MSADPIKNVFTQIGEALNKKLGELAQPVRVALTGKTVSPGIFDVLLLAGREISLIRIEAALALARTPFSASPSPTGKDLS